MFSTLWKKTKEVASLYTGTFIIIMLLNQLLFFGFCLNPICLVAAMPHVLFITVVVGTWLNRKNAKEKNIAESRQALKQDSVPKLSAQDLDEKFDELLRTIDTYEKNKTTNAAITTVKPHSHVKIKANTYPVTARDSLPEPIKYDRSPKVGWGQHQDNEIFNQSSDEFKTWSQWQKVGRQVIKGSLCKRINNIANFSYEQTIPLTLANENSTYTYDEWNAKGFQVKKGAKSLRVRNKSVFLYKDVFKR